MGVINSVNETVHSKIRLKPGKLEMFRNFAEEINVWWRISYVESAKFSSKELVSLRPLFEEHANFYLF